MTIFTNSIKPRSLFLPPRGPPVYLPLN